MGMAIYVATTSNLVGTYDNGPYPSAPGIGATITITATGDLIVDGTVVLLNDLVLVKDQLDQTQNGIYYISTQGDVGVQPVLTRSALFNTPYVVNAYGLIGIIDGISNGATIWSLENEIHLIGTDTIVFINMLPKSGYIVCNARLAKAATNNTLSAVTFDTVDFGAQYFQGSAPYTGFICPKNGIYEFRISGWKCGDGDGTIEVINTRSAVIVYDQTWQVINGDCTTFHDHWYVPNCEAGDIITFKVNENTGGTNITSITDNTDQSQGNFVAIYWAQF